MGGPWDRVCRGCDVCVRSWRQEVEVGTGDTVQTSLGWRAGRSWFLASWPLFWGPRTLKPKGCVAALLESWVAVQ